MFEKKRAAITMISFSLIVFIKSLENGISNLEIARYKDSKAETKHDVTFLDLDLNDEFRKYEPHLYAFNAADFLNEAHSEKVFIISITCAT